jgi:PAS domain S-box-containing protein
VLTVAEHEPMRTVLQRGAAGMLARRTLPVVVVLPLVLGRMRVGLQQGGFVDTGFGSALRSLVEIFLLTGLLWGAARLVREHEEALRDSEAAERDTAVQRNLLAAIVQTSEDAIVSKTLDGIVTSWNEGARQLLGYSADEMIGQSITKIMPPERVGDLHRIIAQIRAGERIEHFETERIRKDGRRIPVSLTVSPIRDASGRIVGASKIARDITERRRAERELHQTLDVLSTLNRTAILLSAELDLTKLVQTVTDVATEAIGARYGAFFYNVESPDGGVYSLYTLSGAPYSAFDRLGMPRATALFGPTFRGEAVIRLDDVRDDPRYGRSEPHFGMPPGHLPVVSYLAVPVVLRGEVLGGLFFAHPEPGRFSDRDERFVVGLAAQTAIAMENARLYHAERRSRAEAEAANRAKDELLSVVSHELRTPLAGMLGWTDLLRRGRVPAERQGAILDAIARGGRLQARLIDDLLDVSRLVSGRLTLVPEPIDLRAVLEATLEAIRPEAVSQDVEIASRCASGIRVSGDPARLQQVLANVLGNALKYTPSGRSIHVDVAHADGRAIVTVRDQGEGIEPELLPHVFEPFRQGSDIRKRTGGGLGLGLTIVKRIIEQHGGEVTIHSDGLHRGTVVRITLPVLQERESERDRSGPDALRESSSDA